MAVSPRSKPETVRGQPTAKTIERIDRQLAILFRDLRISSHNLLSAKHPDTVEDDVTRGALVTGQAHTVGATTSIKWKRLAIGAAARVLRSDGTDVSWAQVVLTTDVTGILPVGNGGTGTSTAFTAGSVVFAGASGVYAQDNANFFWDDTNNRLGLGSASPTVRLDVFNNSLAAAATETVRLVNSTAATAGTPRQVSPALILSGQGWDTDDLVSRTVRVAIYGRPDTTATLRQNVAFAFDSGTDPTFVDDIYIATDGIRFRDGNLVFRDTSRGIAFTANPLTDSVTSAPRLEGGGNGQLKYVGTGSDVRFFVEQNTNGTTGIPCFDARMFDATTSNSFLLGLRLKAHSNGTAAAGFGSRILLQASSTTTNYRDQAAIDSLWTTATDASRTADLRFLTVNNAAALAEVARLTGAGLLGVGLTAPVYRVHAQGSSEVNSQIAAERTSADDNGPRIRFLKSRSTSGAAAVNDDEVGRLIFSFRNSTPATFDGSLITSVATNITAGSETTRMTFQTSVGGTLATRMQIAADGKVQINNTGAALAWLHVQGNSTDNVMTFRTGAAGASFLTGQNSSGVTICSMDDISGSARVDLLDSGGSITIRLDAAAAMLKFGTSSSFPAIKRNSTVLEVKLADDSAFAEIKALDFRVSDGNFMIRSAAAFTDGAAAATGTLTNAPAAGNPTKWIPVDDNGTTRYIPAW